MSATWWSRHPIEVRLALCAAMAIGDVIVFGWCVGWWWAAALGVAWEAFDFWHFSRVWCRAEANRWRLM